MKKSKSTTIRSNGSATAQKGIKRLTIEDVENLRAGVGGCNSEEQKKKEECAEEREREVF